MQGSTASAEGSSETRRKRQRDEQEEGDGTDTIACNTCGHEIRWKERMRYRATSGATIVTCLACGEQNPIPGSSRAEPESDLPPAPTPPPTDALLPSLATWRQHVFSRSTAHSRLEALLGPFGQPGFGPFDAHPPSEEEEEGEEEDDAEEHEEAEQEAVVVEDVDHVDSESDTNYDGADDLEFGCPDFLVTALPTREYALPRARTRHAVRARDEAIPQCVVCQFQFEDGAQLKRLPCLHEFHDECISQWLCRSMCCPLCNHNVLVSAASLPGLGFM